MSDDPHPPSEPLDGDALPAHLHQRCRPSAPPREGEFVLYWMRVAVRAHENPALDVALHLARRLGRPLLVFHALDERYPHASDRHHRFILEGARDAQQKLHERGIAAVFHLARRGHRPPALKQLARRSCAVVTEEFPLQPLRGWSDLVAGLAPLWEVDSSCLAPLGSLPGAPDRAFRFRERAQRWWDRALASPWPEVDFEFEVAFPAEARPQAKLPAEADAEPGRPELPFEPLELQHADLGEWIARCEIDHSVAPVPGVEGGSQPGYRRWEEFRAQGLARYASRRNDPLKDGTSRLSPYLHYGHVSPWRIAREAQAAGGAGARKFLDELLLWREIAWHLCANLEVDPHSWEALPDWARRSLDQHQADPRPRLLDLEALDRGRSGDALWDASQDSLRIHGQLHNNLRMTWGKAFVQWSADPREALARCFHLNDRYALDGRDPGSVGGILWCFGALDRPFSPPRPVLGEVRPRPTDEHARRTDIGALRQQTSRAAMAAPPRVAIVGAGVAGLAAARTLVDHGLQVELFDRGRAPAGRAASRRDGEAHFDHGAQYFTTRDPRFARMVPAWCQAGVLAPWEGSLGRIAEGTWSPSSDDTPRYVGVPSMSAWTRHLAKGLHLHAGVGVEELRRQGDLWTLLDGEGQSLGDFDRVVLAMPAPQARSLVDEHFPELAQRLGDSTAIPCYATLLRFDQRLDLDWDGAQLDDEVLAWAARDSSKPGRAPGERWVLHSTEAFARQHIVEDDREKISRLMTERLSALVPAWAPPSEQKVHRWGCARTTPLEGGCAFSTEGARKEEGRRGDGSGTGTGRTGSSSEGASLFVAADSFGPAKIQSAWLSGIAAAGRLLAPARPPQMARQGSLFAE